MRVEKTWTQRKVIVLDYAVKRCWKHSKKLQRFAVCMLYPTSTYSDNSIPRDQTPYPSSYHPRPKFQLSCNHLSLRSSDMQI